MDAANAAFSLAFLLEAALKLAALGPLRYLGDGLNCFDLLLVLLSVVELLLEVGRLGGGWWVGGWVGASECLGWRTPPDRVEWWCCCRWRSWWWRWVGWLVAARGKGK